MQVHEWYVPDGDHAQLLQAIHQARAAKATFLRCNDRDLSDSDVWFKAADDGVIVYYEIDVTSKKNTPKPPDPDPDPWRMDEPPF